MPQHHPGARYGLPGSSSGFRSTTASTCATPRPNRSGSSRTCGPGHRRSVDPGRAVGDRRIDAVTLWGRWSGVTLAVSIIDVLDGIEEAGVVGRVDLDQIDDRDDAATP